MSHHQSKGDRSEVQLKRAGRSSGAGHQRSGAPSAAVKGGGAGGPSPSGSAPPSSGASFNSSQSFPAGAASGRPTTPGSSSNRGGKRANGPTGIGRNPHSGGSTDHGGNYRSSHFSAQYQSQQSQQQPPAPVIRQGVGAPEANQHSSTGGAGQSDLKQTTPPLLSPNTSVGGVPRVSGIGGGPIPKQPSNAASGAPFAASKPPAPVGPSASAAVLEPAAPVVPVSSGDALRQTTQPQPSFVFGSFTHELMNVGTKKIRDDCSSFPARTNSAPPNIDEQKREQERFEASRSAAAAAKKVPTVPSGQQQGNVVRTAANAIEQPQPVLHASQNVHSRGGPTNGAPGIKPPQSGQPPPLAQPPVQFPSVQGHPPSGQGHGAPHSQNQMQHIPGPGQVPQHLQHMQMVQQAQAHHAQAQAHAQTQQAQVQQGHNHQQHQQHQQHLQQHQPQQQQQQGLPQQGLPPQQSLPQQGMVQQQNLSQGLKYPQVMAPHGSQVMPPQIGTPMAGQLSGQQVPPHQLGPPMGGPMGGQLPPGIPGPPYVTPAMNQYANMKAPERRPVKIINPATQEEVKFDGAKAKKGEPFMDSGPSASVPTSSTVRVSSNGPPQNRPGSYGSGPHHGMVHSMGYYSPGPYTTHGTQAFYQPVPSKSVPNPSGPIVNQPPVSRYGYGPQAPSQGMRFVNHPPNPPTAKGPTAAAATAAGGGNSHGGQVATTDMSSSGLSSGTPSVSASGGPAHPVAPALAGRGGVPASQSLHSGGAHAPASNGRTAAGLVGPTSTGVPNSSLPLTPSLSVGSSAAGFKFGDVESSNSAAPPPSGEAPASNKVAGTLNAPLGGNAAVLNAADPPGVPNHALPALAVPEGIASSRRDAVGRAGNTPLPAATQQKAGMGLAPSKPPSAASGTSDISPRVAATPPNVSGLPVEKPKAEITPKPTITRENSRKGSKKEQKQNKQQQQHHQQPPTPSTQTPVTPVGEGEGETKSEILTPFSSGAASALTPSTGDGNVHVAPPPKAALQRSHSGLQSSGSGSYAVKVGRSDDHHKGGGSSKVVAELDRRASGKATGISPKNSDAAAAASSYSTVLGSEEGTRKTISKQGSGKVLASAKSLETKDASDSTLSSAKPGTSAKHTPSSTKAVSSTATIAAKEPSIGHVGELLSPKVSEAQDLLMPEVPKDSSAIAGEVTEKSVPVPYADPASETDPTKNRVESKVEDDAATSSDVVRPETPALSASLSASLPAEGKSGAADVESEATVLSEAKLDQTLESLTSKDPENVLTDVTPDSSANLQVAEEGSIPILSDNLSGIEQQLPILKDAAAPEPVDSTPPLATDPSSDLAEIIDQKESDMEEPVPTVSSEEVPMPSLPAEEVQPSVPADEGESKSDVISPSNDTVEGIESTVADTSKIELEHPSVESVMDIEDIDSEIPVLSDSGVPVEVPSSVNNPAETEAASVEPEAPTQSGAPMVSTETLVAEKDTDLVEEELPNGVSSDDGVAAAESLSRTVSDVQLETGELTEERSLRESPDNTSATGANPNVEADTLSASSGGPDLKRVRGGKKKMLKELLQMKDAQGPTSDLYNAYKAVPEEKKLEEGGKRVEASGSANPGLDTKKDSLSNFRKAVVKEVDDWEDAAELPTPGKIAPTTPSAVASPSVSSVSGEPSSSDLGLKKYTKDYLISQRYFHPDLPTNFEIPADIAGNMLIPSVAGAFTHGLPSPGRVLDRQPSGGARLDRNRSNLGMEDDRWTRQAGPLASPGRSPSEAARMEQMGLSGPAGGFRPGQGTNTGLMRMPPNMRTGMGPPGLMAPGMGGLLPGGPSGLLPHGMMSPMPGRNVGGVDADRWQRAPVVQKGIMPSPRTPLPAIHKTENRYQVGKVSDEEQIKQRQIKSVLNKLTPQNFDKLFVKVKEVNIDSATTLTGVISQIFDKALTEPTFCEMYAEFCAQLAKELPEFTEDDVKITFKRVLLNKCQEEFERGRREQEEAEKVEEEGEVKLSDEEREEKRTNARRRMLGNIRFIGELYKKNMLTERIMHECIKELLGSARNPDEEDVEALCKLMSTIGRMIDHPKAKEHMDAYFKRMEMMSENMKLSSRLRFMLKDVIDLRRNGWMERRKVEGPKKIDEVHRDAVQERQNAASGRDGPQRGGSMLPGRRPPGMDFTMRGGPQSPLYSPGQMGGAGGKPMGGLRGSQPSPSMRGGYGQQDVRNEDRGRMEDRLAPMLMPMTHRPSDEGPIMLGPQGGLGRGMGPRQTLVPGSRSSALAEIPPGMLDRRPGMGVPGGGFGGMVDRSPYGGPPGRDELPMRGGLSGPERYHVPADRGGPLLERPLGPDRGGAPSMSLGRDSRGPDRPVERQPLSLTSSSLRPLTPPTPANVRSAPSAPSAPSAGPYVPPSAVPHTPSPAASTPSAPLPLSDDDLRKKSISTITEYFSVRDMKEAAQCVDDLKNPSFHPTMVSLWVSEAFDKKDADRDHLVKLLIYICMERDSPSVTQEHVRKGFELVLSQLEDTYYDVPKSPEYIGGMFAKFIVAGVLTLVQVAKLLREGGMDPGSLIESGHSLTVIGVLLDGIKRQKNEKAVVDLCRDSKVNVEDFLSPNDNRTEGKFDSFLEQHGLQFLYPMKPVENYFREAMARDEPVADMVKWVEENVPAATISEPLFSRMLMTQVLKKSVPLDIKVVTPNLEKDLVTKIRKYAPLLKSPKDRRTKDKDASQRHYIVAVQLFANDLGHPSGLIHNLFNRLYAEDVIDERVFYNWKDDVRDTTPGRDKAIKDTFTWFRWLDEAPEEVGDDE